MLLTALLWLYAQGLRGLPAGFRAEFGAEMAGVFGELLAAAAERGAAALLAAAGREFGSLPLVWWRLHRRTWGGGWMRAWAALRSPFQPVPPAGDGRDAWAQTLLECGPLLAAGGLLLALTYAQPLWRANFPRLTMGEAAPWLGYGALAIFLLGLGRGLPRWSFPAAGLWWGALLFTAGSPALVSFWVGVLLAVYGLALLAVHTHRRRAPLPPMLGRLGGSLALDWTRVSLAFYTLLPYALASAFDDTQADGRSGWLALAALAMVAGAVAYCRSRTQQRGLAALAAGAAAALGMAVAEQVWRQSRGWPADMGWPALLLSGLLLLLLLPMVGSVASRGWRGNGAPHTGPLI